MAQTTNSTPHVPRARSAEVKRLVMGGLAGVLGEYRPAFQRRMIAEYLAEIDAAELETRYVKR